MTLLISVTIKVALLMLGALAVTALLHRLSAALRHWVLATTLLCCVCVPAVELFLPSWSITVPAGWLTSSITSSLRLSSDRPAIRVESHDGIKQANDATPLNPMLSPVTILTAVWIAGALTGLAALA